MPGAMYLYPYGLRFSGSLVLKDAWRGSLISHGLRFSGSFVLQGVRAIHSFSYDWSVFVSLVFKDAWGDSLISIWLEVFLRLRFTGCLK